ncbi:MAG TPA: GNAT family N-acetyltransferase [Candidatus Baltobacteraceae bacterium]
MVETARLRIVALTKEQLDQYMDQNPLVVQSLGVGSVSRDMSPATRKSFEDLIVSKARAAVDSELLFYTIWTVIHRELNRTVGDVIFRGPPNDRGEIEIGYGMYAEFRNRGVMTEAVAGMLGWARARADVTTVTATTRPDNDASMAVLRKNGFERDGQLDGCLVWRFPVTSL